MLSPQQILTLIEIQRGPFDFLGSGEEILKKKKIEHRKVRNNLWAFGSYGMNPFRY